MGKVKAITYRFYSEMLEPLKRLAENAAALEVILRAGQTDTMEVDGVNLVYALCTANVKGGRGGQAHSQWYCGVHHRGVYLYAHNHRLGVIFTEAPDIDCGGACQDSRCYGDAQPKPERGQWVRWADIPEAAHPAIRQTIREILLDVHASIAQQVAHFEAEAAARAEAHKQKQQEINAAWTAQ